MPTVSGYVSTGGSSSVSGVWTNLSSAEGSGAGDYTVWSPTDPFTLGTTKPDATNTGYAMAGFSAATLTDNFPAGPKYIYTISADNTVVTGLRIHGRVNITGNNCTLRGCEIVGHLNMAYDTTTDYGLVNSSGTGNLIDRCEITLYDDSTSTDNSTGSSGTLDTYWPVGVLMTAGSCTVNRCNIHDVNDLTYCTAGTHTVQGNYLHDPMFRNDDQDQSGSTPAYWSHNDGFQIMGGTGIVFNGNALDMKFSDQTGMNRSGVGAGAGSQGTGNPNPSTTSEQAWRNCHGMLIQTHNAAISNLTISNNWFRYGSACIRFAAGSFDPGGAVTLTGNRFTPDQGLEFSQYRQIVIDPNGSWSTTPPSIDNTNVYSSDSDTPSAVRGLPINGNPTGNPFTSGSGSTAVKAWMYNSTTHTGNVPLSLTP